MCKGIAIGINDKEIVMNHQDSSHTSIKNFNEDTFLKINIIYDNTTAEGYRIEVDNHDKEQLEIYKREAFINEKNEIVSSYKKRLVDYCKEHELEIFKLFASGLMQSSKTGDVDFTYSTVGNVDFVDSKTKDIDFNNSITEDVYFFSSKMGKIDLFFSETKDINLVGMKTGNIYIRDLKLKNSDKYTKLISEFSKTKQKNYDFISFCDWLIRRSR